MDYKYIEQLLERYWRCETTVEEESILRTFFSQTEVPASLKRYQSLFALQQEEKTQHLGADFDERLLAIIDEPQPTVMTVQAERLTLTRRLRPLLRAAAVVGVVLTLGQAVQVAVEQKQASTISQYDGYTAPQPLQGSSVAMVDSAGRDTLQHSMLLSQPTKHLPTIK